MEESPELDDLQYSDSDLTLFEATSAVPETMNAFFETASVDRVYGLPIDKGGITIIPAAEVLTVMGFGTGYGTSRSLETDPKDSAAGGGGGGGGGGKTLARPAAVVVISPEGVYVEPVVDRTKVLLAAITAIGFMAATLFGFLSPKKALKQISGN